MIYKLIAYIGQYVGQYINQASLFILKNFCAQKRCFEVYLVLFLCMINVHDWHQVFTF